MTGRAASKRSAREQKQLIAAQQKREDLRLADSADDIARRKFRIGSKAKGRQSLIKTSPTGLATNLGGTTSV